MMLSSLQSITDQDQLALFRHRGVFLAPSRVFTMKFQKKVADKLAKEEVYRQQDLLRIYETGEENSSW